MSRGTVHVQLVDGNPVRIFRTEKSAWLAKAHDESLCISTYPHKDAVAAIRRQVFERSKGQCEFCGRAIDWNFQLHEKQPRGDVRKTDDGFRGGEISLENSVAICYPCHQGRKDSEHGNRRLRFGEEA